MKKFGNFKTWPQKLSALFFVAIFAGLGAYFLVFTHAATYATLTLSPATSTTSQGSNFAVTIVENSGTSPVSTVIADMSFDPTKLQVVGIDTSTSSFNQFPDKSYDNTTGSINLTFGYTPATGQPTALTGQKTVAVVTFQAKGTGTTNVSFLNTTAVLIGTAGTSTVDNVLSSATGGTYTLNDTTPPTTPTGLTAPSKTETSINLSWTASTDPNGGTVAGYNVYRNGTKIASPTTNSYTVTGLTPNTAYSFTVQAFDSATPVNNSAQSTALSVTTLADTTPPTVPTGLTAPAKTDTSVSLSWTASTDPNGTVAGYNVYRNGTKIASPTTNSYTVTGLTPSTSYSFTVDAFDNATPVNTSAKSTALSVTTNADTQAPTVPGKPSTSALTCNSVTLSWAGSTDNVGVGGYNVYDGSTKITTTTSTTFTHSSLDAGSTHSYTVEAFDVANPVNTSAKSAATSIITVLKAGDVNGDCAINITDLTIMALHWKQDPATRAEGNLSTGDTKVDGTDLAILCANWGL